MYNIYLKEKKLLNIPGVICARFLKDYELNCYEGRNVIDITGFPYMNAFWFFSPLFLKKLRSQELTWHYFQCWSGMKISYLDTIYFFTLIILPLKIFKSKSSLY